MKEKKESKGTREECGHKTYVPFFSEGSSSLHLKLGFDAIFKNI